MDQRYSDVSQISNSYIEKKMTPLHVGNPTLYFFNTNLVACSVSG